LEERGGAVDLEKLAEDVKKEFLNGVNRLAKRSDTFKGLLSDLKKATDFIKKRIESNDEKRVSVKHRRSYM